MGPCLITTPKHNTTSKRTQAALRPVPRIESPIPDSDIVDTENDDYLKRLYVATCSSLQATCNYNQFKKLLDHLSLSDISYQYIFRRIAEENKLMPNMTVTGEKPIMFPESVQLSYAHISQYFLNYLAKTNKEVIAELINHYFSEAEQLKVMVKELKPFLKKTANISQLKAIETKKISLMKSSHAHLSQSIQRKKLTRSGDQQTKSPDKSLKGGSQSITNLQFQGSPNTVDSGPIMIMNCGSFDLLDHIQEPQLNKSGPNYSSLDHYQFKEIHNQNEVLNEVELQFNQALNLELLRASFVDLGFIEREYELTRHCSQVEDQNIATERAVFISVDWWKQLLIYLGKKYRLRVLESLLQKTMQDNRSKLQSSQKRSSVSQKQIGGFSWFQRIDNSSICGDLPWQLRPNIIHVSNYILVDEYLYNKLHLLYGDKGYKLLRFKHPERPYYSPACLSFAVYRIEEKYLTDERVQHCSLSNTADIVQKILNPRLLNEQSLSHQGKFFIRVKGSPWVEIRGPSELEALQICAQTYFIAWPSSAKDCLDFSKLAFEQNLLAGSVYAHQQTYHNVTILSTGPTTVQFSKGIDKRILSLVDFQKSYKSLNQKSCLTHIKMKGLANIGNSCYLNVIIQIIIAIQTNQLLKSDNSLAKAISQIQQRSWANNEHMSLLKAIIDQKTNIFHGNDQHDAHEFLMWALSQLESGSSDFTKYFTGQMTRFVQCQECETKSTNKQQFTVLNLPMVNTASSLIKILYVKGLVERWIAIEVTKDSTMQDLFRSIQRKLRLASQEYALFEVNQDSVLKPISVANNTQKGLNLDMSSNLVIYDLKKYQTSFFLKRWHQQYYVLPETLINTNVVIGEEVSSNSTDIQLMYMKDETMFNVHRKLDTVIRLPCQELKNTWITIRLKNVDKNTNYNIHKPFLIRMETQSSLYDLEDCVKKMLYIVGGFEIRVAKKNSNTCYNCDKASCSNAQNFNSECFQLMAPRFPLLRLSYEAMICLGWPSQSSLKASIIRVPYDNDAAAKSTNLSESLRIFEESQSIYGHCQTCKKSTSSITRERIENLPPKLIIHLQRFYYDKQTTSFQKTLTPWYLEQEVTLHNHTYCLEGVILHSGNAMSGHYTVQINGIRYDDHRLRLASMQSISLSEVYMVFYRLKDF